MTPPSANHRSEVHIKAYSTFIYLGNFNFVNNTNLTNFIIKEYVQEDLYENEDNIESFNKILINIGSNYMIEEFDEINWIYLSQD